MTFVYSESSDKIFLKEMEGQLYGFFDKFDSLIKKYAKFHFCFLGVLLAALFSFFLLFPIFAEAFFLAFSISAIFLTIFSYLVFLFYLQNKRPQQFEEILQEYVSNVKRSMHHSVKGSDSFFIKMSALKELDRALNGREYLYYSWIKTSSNSAVLLKKFSAWAHWRDVYRIREMLFFASLEEHLDFIKEDPLNLSIHGSLATLYLGFARVCGKEEKDFWIPKAYFSEEMIARSKAAAKKAIEELKILKSYSPNDLWARGQLVLAYHFLELIPEEILECEEILQLRSEDNEALFRLGMLYFKQGINANGLKIYEELKSKEPEKAKDLLEFYSEGSKSFS